MKTLLLLGLLVFCLPVFAQETDPFHPGWVITKKERLGIPVKTITKRRFLNSDKQIKVVYEIYSSRGDTILNYLLEEIKEYKKNDWKVPVYYKLNKFYFTVPEINNGNSIPILDTVTYFKPGKTNDFSNKELQYKDTIDKFLINKKTNTKNENYNKIFFCIDASPLFTNTNLTAANTEFTSTAALTQRQNSEMMGSGIRMDVKAGCRVDNSIIYVCLMYMQQHFMTRNATVDWNTGLLQAADPGRYNHLYSQSGFGVGYCNYAWNKNRRGYFDSNLSYVWNNKSFIIGTDSNIGNSTNEGLVGTISLGGVFKFHGCTNFRIGPVFTYNFIPVHRGVVNTYLYSFGLGFGFTFN